MRPSRLGSWVLYLALTHLQAGGFVLHLEVDCPLSADGRVLWANWTLSFNKVPFVCYENDYEAFLPCGLGATFPWNYTAVPIANYLQRIPYKPEQAQRTCQQQIQSLWGRTGGRRTPPNVRIFPVTPRNTAAPIMLACIVWGFYPQEVGISWLWNGAPVQGSIAGVPTLSSNGDWTYQARLTLPVDPQHGGTYTCRVTHASLAAPLTVDWEPGLPTELKFKIGGSVAILGVGIAVLIAGSICWRKRVPQGYVPIEGTNYAEDR